MIAPTLITERLTLRAPVMGDFAKNAAFLAGPRASWMDGPLDTKGAWAYFTSDVALWSLKGVGGLMMQHKDGGAVVDADAASPDADTLVYRHHKGAIQ